MVDFEQRTRQRIHDLKSKTEELREVKEDLQSKLRRARQLQDINDTYSDNSSINEELRRKTIAYWYFGIEPKLTKKGEIYVRISPSNNATGCSPSYYLYILFHEREIQVPNHSLPSFIPLNDMIYLYNSREISLPRMINEIQAYLIAYYQRKKEMEEVAVHFPIDVIEDISSNSAFDFLQITMNASEPFHIHLHYNNLLSSRPTRIRCSFKGSQSLKRVAVKQAFLTLTLMEAIQNVYVQLCSKQTVEM